MTVNIREQSVVMSLSLDQFQSYVLLSAGIPTHATLLAAIQSPATLADHSTATLTGPSVTPVDQLFATPADP
jgi:hypothetical protein